jgi:hypothetical protein
VPVGSFVTNDGETIPAFIGDPIVGSASSSVVRGHPFSSFVGKRVVEGQIIAGDDLPGFSAGKLFISAIRGAINCGARTVGFLDPIPAPIRNVPVEVIVGGLVPLGNIDFINGSHRIPVFLLCFG